ncbi:unnamed protein product, partial [Ectocarpus sp. 12 AP-2014]
LQLVSLAFCGACRSVPTLQVRVDRQLPRSLCCPCISHTAPNKHSRDVCFSSRVPAVQAVGWTWALPANDPLPSCSTELRPGSES